MYVFPSFISANIVSPLSWFLKHFLSIVAMLSRNKAIWLASNSHGTWHRNATLKIVYDISWHNCILPKDSNIFFSSAHSRPSQKNLESFKWPSICLTFYWFRRLFMMLWQAQSMFSVLIPRLPHPVWPDWAIYWTLGNFLKPLATINLPKFPTF